MRFIFLRRPDNCCTWIRLISRTSSCHLASKCWIHFRFWKVAEDGHISIYSQFQIKTSRKVWMQKENSSWNCTTFFIHAIHDFCSVNSKNIMLKTLDWFDAFVSNSVIKDELRGWITFLRNMGSELLEGIISFLSEFMKELSVDCASSDNFSLCFVRNNLSIFDSKTKF